MSHDPKLDGRIAQLRADAAQLLADLEQSRDHVTLRAAEEGRCDPILVVTGSSSLDRAVANVEAIIETVDEVMADQTMATVRQ